MPRRYDITRNSYVLVTDKPTCDTVLYTAQHFKNGCSRGLESKVSTSLQEIEQWVIKLRRVFRNERNN
mgnify:FL=1